MDRIVCSFCEYQLLYIIYFRLIGIFSLNAVPAANVITYLCSESGLRG